MLNNFCFNILWPEAFFNQNDSLHCFIIIKMKFSQLINKLQQNKQRTW